MSLHYGWPSPWTDEGRPTVKRTFRPIAFVAVCLVVQGCRLPPGSEEYLQILFTVGLFGEKYLSELFSTISEIAALR